MIVWKPYYYCVINILSKKRKQIYLEFCQQYNGNISRLTNEEYFHNAKITSVKFEKNYFSNRNIVGKYFETQNTEQ